MTFSAATELLRVENLSVRFGASQVIDDLSFTVRPGRTTAVVGESGSGKSVTSMSIMRLADMAGANYPRGRIVFRRENEDIDLLAADQKSMRRIRGNDIAMIFQEPMTSLNPVFTVGDQLAEVLMLHEGMKKSAALAEAGRLLTLVRLPDATSLLTRYPHQLSGGMRQRVAIAIALLHQPAVLIADEPTTALDVSIQGQILAEVRRLADDTGTAIVWITHDLAVVSSLADDICVMYAGRIVERGPAEAVIGRPLHPYTRGLMDSVPARHEPGTPLPQIPGSTPSLLNLPSGCPFRIRCPRASERCATEPPEVGSATHSAHCHHPLGDA